MSAVPTKHAPQLEDVVPFAVSAERGKKKMAKLGRVDVPTDVFIKLLKH